MELKHNLKGAKQGRTVTWNFKNQGIAYKISKKFYGHLPSVGVPSFEGPHEYIDTEEPVSVHGTNVIQHVFICRRYDHGNDQEIHTKQHLQNAPQRIVSSDPEE